MKTPIILLRSLNVDRGGITKATLKRANMFAQKFSEVIIITTLFQPKHKQIINELRQRGELAKNIIVYNFFEELRNERPKPFLNKKIKHSVRVKNYTEILVENHPDKSYRYYRDGLYKMYRRFEKDEIKFIDYMNESGQRVQRLDYDENGLLVRKRFMDIVSNKPHFDQYFDFKGECMLSVHLDVETGKERIIVHFGEEPISFNNLDTMQIKWLNRLLKNIAEPVLFNELRGFDNLVYKIKHPNIKKIAVIHSSHLKEPYDDIDSLRPAYRRLFTKNLYDRYIFLTKNQKVDVEKVFGSNNKYTIIPHAYNIEDINNHEKIIEQSPYLVVQIARYAADKRIDEAILSFSLVVKQEPKAQLYIYGNGPLEKKLRSLINELGLQKNVFLKGYINNPLPAYRLASCSIITSRREGFGLVMIESMLVGTPVVAYDFKYGPRDIINDGENGYIVENGSREQLAEKILQIIRDEDLRNRLSKNALEIQQKYNELKYKEEWLRLLK